MFDQVKQQWKMMQMMQRLMKDENFKALMAEPRVQELMKDADFQALIKTQDPTKIAASPKLAAIMRDPEIAKKFAKLDLKSLMQA